MPHVAPLGAPQPADRRRAPRWTDKRLLVLRVSGRDEQPGMTADICAGGLRVAVTRDCGAPGSPLQLDVAFAQEVVEIYGHLIHTRRRPWGLLAGIRFVPGQEDLVRYLTRRYPPPASRTQPLRPLRWPTPETLRVLPGLR